MNILSDELNFVKYIETARLSIKVTIDIV